MTGRLFQNEIAFLPASFYIVRFLLKPRQGVRGLKLNPVVKPPILFLSFTRSRFLSRLNQYVREYYLYRTMQKNKYIDFHQPIY